MFQSAANKIIITVLFVCRNAGVHDCVTNYMWSRHLFEEMLNPSLFADAIGCFVWSVIICIALHHFTPSDFLIQRPGTALPCPFRSASLHASRVRTYSIERYCQQSIKYFKLIIFRGYVWAESMQPILLFSTNALHQYICVQWTSNHGLGQYTLQISLIFCLL